MPKQRSRKPRKIKRRIKRDNLGIYLLVGFMATLALWFLVKDPLPETSAVSSNAQLENDKPAKKSERKSKVKPARKKGDSAKLQTQQNKAPESPIEGRDEVDLDKAIANTIAKLGIPKNYYKRRSAGNQVSFSIPIDKSQMDLTYANMIFKGDLERQGAVLVKGSDSSGKQVLLFRSRRKPKEYLVTLFYDNKLYEKKTNPRTIAIVIDDFGSISGELLDGFFDLDPSISFAIFPDEPHSVETMQRAKAQGRTSLIHIPMEPIGFPSVNPGKNAILVQFDNAQIDKILSRAIAKLPDCEGINNHMGSLATTDEAVMQAVMSTLKKHNKFFLDSRTSNVSVGYSTAQKSHLRSFRNDLFLDSPNISQSNLDAKLTQIIELSATKSNIIAITHCHNKEKLDYLKRFVAKLKAAGFTLVPLTEIGKYKVPEIL